MELGWLIGLIGGLLFLTVSFYLGSGDLSIYIDFPSFLTTVVGSFLATMITQPLSNIKGLLTGFKISSRKYSVDVSALIETLITFAEKARREGVLSLEDDVAEIPDVFLKKSIQLVVDGTDPAIVTQIMEQEISQMENRHGQVKKLFDDWAYLAPSLGMIGTLQGLVAMLRNMSDVSSIGKNMAIALITTLYGAILANVVLIPVASRLDLYNKYDVLVKEIIIEGVRSIQAGDNPAILREKLSSFLPQNKRPKEEQG